MSLVTEKICMSFFIKIVHKVLYDSQTSYF